MTVPIESEVTTGSESAASSGDMVSAAANAALAFNDFASTIQEIALKVETEILPEIDTKHEEVTMDLDARASQWMTTIMQEIQAKKTEFDQVLAKLSPLVSKIETLLDPFLDKIRTTLGF